MRYFLMILFLLFPLSVQAGEHAWLAVLQFSGVGIKPEVLFLLSDQAREGTMNAIDKDKISVLTRENMQQLLADNGLDITCIEGKCEVETGRNIGADYVISGSVVSMGGEYILTLKFHETKGGRLLSTKSIDDTSLNGLRKQTIAITEQLVSEALDPGDSNRRKPEEKEAIPQKEVVKQSKPPQQKKIEKKTEPLQPKKKAKKSEPPQQKTVKKTVKTISPSQYKTLGLSSGLVLNNPMMLRYTGTAQLGIQREKFGLGLQYLYSPDLGVQDMKDSFEALIPDSEPNEKIFEKMTSSIELLGKYRISQLREETKPIQFWGGLGVGMMTTKTYAGQLSQEELSLLFRGQERLLFLMPTISCDVFLFSKLLLSMQIDDRIYQEPEENLANSESQIYNDINLSVGLKYAF